MSANDSSAAMPAKIIIVAAIVIVYAALSYYCDCVPQAAGLAAGLSLAPVLLISAVYLWRWARPLIAWSITLAVVGLLYRYWEVLKDNYQWSNLIQQCGTYGLVALGFARSLLPRRTPICTLLAEKAHGPLNSSEIGYTRKATLVWAAFYVVLTAAIAILFFAASIHFWSLFVNFAAFGLIGLMFAVEHAVRRRLLPHRPPGSTLTALRHLLGG